MSEKLFTFYKCKHDLTLFVGQDYRFWSFGISLSHSFGLGGWHVGVWYCQDGFVSFDFIKVSLRIGRGF